MSNEDTPRFIAVSREALEDPRDLMAEIQDRLWDAVIEREIAALAEFTGEAFARHVYRYPISVYIEGED